MKTGTKTVFVADDGSEHDTLDKACQRSVEHELFGIMGCGATDHRTAHVLRELAGHWQVVHAMLLRINHERVRIADEEGIE